MMNSEIPRVCRDCGASFQITAEEQALFRELAATKTDTDWQLPNRCSPCRQARRLARERAIDDGTDEMVRCIDCKTEFLYGSRDKSFYARQGWRRPRRCRLCREAHRQTRTERP